MGKDSNAAGRDATVDELDASRAQLDGETGRHGKGGDDSDCRVEKSDAGERYDSAVQWMEWAERRAVVGRCRWCGLMHGRDSVWAVLRLGDPHIPTPGRPK
jgi:hypothetical protein